MQQVQKRPKAKHKVLIADDETHFVRRMAEFLGHYDCEVRTVRTVSEAKEVVQFWRPQTLFVNLVLPETNAMSLVRFINQRAREERPYMAVMSKQALPEAISQLSRAGVENYLLKPFVLDEALGVVTESRRRDPAFIDPNPDGRQSFNSVKELHLLNLILRQALSSEGADRRMFNLMRMINIKLNAVRCSLIRYLNDDSGIVMASNDDANIRGFPLALSKYPEIRLVRKRHRPLVIANTRQSDLMAPVRNQMALTAFETMVLFPVYFHGDFYGVLSLRMNSREERDIFYVEKFGQVCSQIISISMSAHRQIYKQAHTE